MVLAVRLDKREESHLAFFSRRRHLKRSQAAKELMERGFLLSQLDEHRNGNISLGRLAEILDISVVEALNLVGVYNAQPAMPAEMLNDASANSRKLFR